MLFPSPMALVLPLRAAGVVEPARESPAVPVGLVHVIGELAPGAGDAQSEAVVLRPLVVADPLVRPRRTRLVLVHHAVGGLERPRLFLPGGEGYAVRREDADRMRLDLRHLVVLAVELHLLAVKEGLQPRLEERLVLLDPEAVLPGHLVPAALAVLRVGIGMIASHEVALVDVDRRLAPLERDRIPDVADQPVVAGPAGVVAHPDFQKRRLFSPLADGVAHAQPLHRPGGSDVLVAAEELLALRVEVLALPSLHPDRFEHRGIADRILAVR